MVFLFAFYFLFFWGEANNEIAGNSKESVKKQNKKKPNRTNKKI